MADSSRIHSDICFKNKVETFAFLLRDVSGFAEKSSGNSHIKSLALGMAFRNRNGAGVSGIMRSCPWNWHIWSGSDKTLHSGDRRVAPEALCEFVQTFPEGTSSGRSFVLQRTASADER